MFFINLNDTFLERFDMAKFMEYHEDTYDILTSYMISNVKKLNEIGQYTVSVEEQRADLISFNIYGDTQYWWILMLYNDIFDPSEILSGFVFKFPSLSDLEDLLFSLKSLESATT